MNREPTAPDGSPVDLYALLPPLGEPAVIHSAIPAGAEILELGCGTGRITRALLELGHSVVAVDESAEMLARVQGAETVRSRIEDLDLGDRRFDAVLLMSNLVNTPAEQRAAFLDTCSRHVADDGVVLIERLPPDWQPEPGSENEAGAVTIRLLEARREGRDVAGTVEYVGAGGTWRHEFENHLLDDTELGAALADARLELSRVLDDPGRWVEAKPRS